MNCQSRSPLPPGNKIPDTCDAPSARYGGPGNAACTSPASTSLLPPYPSSLTEPKKNSHLFAPPRLPRRIRGRRTNQEPGVGDAATAQKKVGRQRLTSAEGRVCRASHFDTSPPGIGCLPGLLCPQWPRGRKFKRCVQIGTHRGVPRPPQPVPPCGMQKGEAD